MFSNHYTYEALEESLPPLIVFLILLIFVIRELLFIEYLELFALAISSSIIRILDSATISKALCFLISYSNLKFLSDNRIFFLSKTLRSTFEADFSFRSWLYISVSCSRFLLNKSVCCFNFFSPKLKVLSKVS